MKYVTIAAMMMALGLAGCKDANDVGSSNSGDITYINRCIDGVTYLVKTTGYTGHLSVKLDRNSKVIPC